MAKLSTTPPDVTVLVAEQRKALSFALSFTDGRERAVDLTGSQLRLTAGTLSPFPGVAPTVLFEVAATITDGPLGYARIDLQPTHLNLSAGAYPYVVTMVTAAGYSAVVVKGEIHVQENPELSSLDDVYAPGDPALALDVQLLGGIVQVEVGHVQLAGDGTFTEAERAKLAGIEPGAQVNVPADWTAEADEPGHILNKPDLLALRDAILLAAHPVGSLYISATDADPATLFGGTWARYAQGRTLIGVDDDDVEIDHAGVTLGADHVTLTAAQSGLRGHTHAVTDGGHTHTQDPHTHALTNGTVPHATHQHKTLMSYDGSALYVTSSGSTAGGTPAPGSSVHTSVGAVFGGTAGSGSKRFDNTYGPNTTQVVSANNATATNQSATTGLTVDAVAAAAAAEAHENRQRSITTYIWRRTA